MAKFLKEIRKQIENLRLRKQEDEVLVERAGEIVVEDKEIATQILGMVKDPNTRLSGLNDLKESLDSEHITDIVNTLQPEEKPLLFEQRGVVKRIKKLNTVESITIIKEAIDRTKEPIEKLNRLYLSADVLSDYDIISVLETIQDNEYGETKLKIISNKIASNYAKFGTSMHIKEFSECISEDLRRLIPSKTAEEFEKLKIKQYDKPVGSYASIEESIKQLSRKEEERYIEGERIKETIDNKNGYTGGYSR